MAQDAPAVFLGNLVMCSQILRFNDTFSVSENHVAGDTPPHVFCRGLFSTRMARASWAAVFLLALLAQPSSAGLLENILCKLLGICYDLVLPSHPSNASGTASLICFQVRCSATSPHMRCRWAAPQRPPACISCAAAHT